MAELNVAAKVRVMPEGVDVDLDEIQKKIGVVVQAFGKVYSSEVKPVAFGLNSLELTFLLSDAQGGLEEIENKVSLIEGVSDFSVLEVTRL
jgi:elongation factor 1-beta